jgi:hypothetical protein
LAVFCCFHSSWCFHGQSFWSFSVEGWEVQQHSSPHSILFKHHFHLFLTCFQSYSLPGLL